MSEQKTESGQKLKAFIKKWGTKTVEFLVQLFAHVAILIFRVFMGVIMLLTGVVMFFSTVILGSRRTAVWMEVVAGILKKYPI